MKPVPNDSTPGTSANRASVPHPHERLSALVDGDPQSVEAACDLWRDDPQARRAWHTYHLIGDVMRSEDL
ncbi:MAG TPA: sigma-E factor negative regulatory protein, partial [Rubrivivax sp.]|nr:sigma-E factor negative regulatory protein [Rubrivivax sp.]